MNHLLSGLLPPRTGWLMWRMLLLAVLWLLRSHYCFTIVIGESMQPNLQTGDILLLDKWAYRHAEPQRGEVLVAHYGKGLVVKRVVGLPGEELEMRRGLLYLNGSVAMEPYPTCRGLLNIGKGRLLNGKYATLGDNRAVPPGQAIHPIVTKDEVVGRVIGRLHF